MRKTYTIPNTLRTGETRIGLSNWIYSEYLAKDVPRHGGLWDNRIQWMFP